LIIGRGRKKNLRMTLREGFLDFATGVGKNPKRGLDYSGPILKGAEQPRTLSSHNVQVRSGRREKKKTAAFRDARERRKKQYYHFQILKSENGGMESYPLARERKRPTFSFRHQKKGGAAGIISRGKKEEFTLICAAWERS